MTRDDDTTMPHDARMTQVITQAPEAAPLYARALRLRHIHPSGMLCFLFFEGAIALAVVLALAELVSWWGVPVLPVVVAAMVKLNDLVAGAAARDTPT